MSADIPAEIKKIVFKLAFDAGPEQAYLFHHLPQVEKWAKKILLEYPEADPEILLSSVWLHDVGNIIGDKNIDHAINSEKYVLEALPKLLHLDQDFIDRVAHCVRSHRCKDVLPQSLEAKILATSDSLSHMTDSIYFEIIELQGIDATLEKLDRDYRDKSLLKLSFSDEIDALYINWKGLLTTIKSL